MNHRYEKLGHGASIPFADVADRGEFIKPSAERLDGARCDDPAERRCMLEAAEIRKAYIVNAPIDAIDHGEGFAGEFVMQPLGASRPVMAGRSCGPWIT